MGKILALDTSTKATGYAIFYNGKLYRYASIEVNNKDPQERMATMVYKIITLIEREAPDVVVIEETVVPRNPQTQRMLTMILGAVFGACVCNNFNYCSLRPTQWRKAVHADEYLPRKREELKVWSLDRVKSLYDIDNITDDVSDAILIGQAFLNINEIQED